MQMRGVRLVSRLPHMSAARRVGVAKKRARGVVITNRVRKYHSTFRDVERGIPPARRTADAPSSVRSGTGRVSRVFEGVAVASGRAPGPRSTSRYRRPPARALRLPSRCSSVRCEGRRRRRRGFAVQRVDYLRCQAAGDSGLNGRRVRADQREALEPTGRRYGKEKPPVEDRTRFIVCAR